MAVTHALFCYGTLCLVDIMRAVSGHAQMGEPAYLTDFQRVSLHGRPYPAIVRKLNAGTQGVLYRGLTTQQLQRIDEYEDRLYRRSRVWVKTNDAAIVEAWTYVLHPRYHRHINRQPWSLADFNARYRKAYKYKHGW